jgi:large subunit ribosomal protein L31/Ran GTPase-activating protein 1
MSHVYPCCPLLQEGLEFLSLQNVGCSVNACKAVAELLVHSAALKGLHLFNNMSDNEGAAHIASVLARAPAMQDFKMASSRVGPAGGCALAKGLSAGGCGCGCGSTRGKRGKTDTTTIR